MKRPTIILSVIALILLGAVSCGEPEINAPQKVDKTAVTEPGTDPGTNPGTDPGTGTETTTAKLCKAEYLGQSPRIIAYMTEYTSASSLDASCLTHINYAHGRFVNKKEGSGGIEIATGSNDLMNKVLKLKESKPSLKVLLMIGGWGEHADGFSMMARDAAKRSEFCHACKQHIDTYGFDGIDIDWEYPGGGPSTNGKSNDDPKNFVLVLKELRDSIGDTKIISYASSSSAGYMDWKGAMLYLDYVNVMTYDMGKPPKGHNSPLCKSSTFNQDGCKESIDRHVAAGVPKSRMNMGVPFYGHGVSPYASDVKFNEMASILKATSGSYAGKNTRKWDNTAKVPYLVDGDNNILLSYDDEESVTEKGKFVKDNSIGGAMFWEYRHDDSNGTLRKALCKAIYGTESTL